MSELATVTLDVSGMPCPAPLLGAKKLIDDLQPGQILRLISDCPGTADDLFSWAKVTGNVVLGSQKQADGKTAYLLAEANRAALKTTATAGGVEVALPAQAPDPVASVVVLEINQARP